MQKIKEYIQKWLGITDIQHELSITNSMTTYALSLSIDNQHKLFDVKNPPIKAKKEKKIISKSKKK